MITSYIVIYLKLYTVKLNNLTILKTEYIFENFYLTHDRCMIMLLDIYIYIYIY